MANTIPNLAKWTTPDIAAECSRAHGRYNRELALQYTSYFAAHPELRGEHRYCAKDIASALPRGCARLALRVSPERWHRHYLSGKSSQVLALGLLGPASEGDLDWLWRLLGPQYSADRQKVDVQFEYAVPRRLLNEEPRVTTVDFLVAAPGIVVCTETKWAEPGLGTCSCTRPDYDAEAEPAIGECAERVLGRPAYWDAAREVFGLPDRKAGEYCPISTAYQAIRNVAAARAMARERGCPACAFLLIYGKNNPYFSQQGETWPGWPKLLEASLGCRAGFVFRHIAWQDLVPTLPLDEEVKAWARDKHRLPA